jgi:hypothetical protein
MKQYVIEWVNEGVTVCVHNLKYIMYVGGSARSGSGVHIHRSGVHIHRIVYNYTVFTALVTVTVTDSDSNSN